VFRMERLCLNVYRDNMKFRCVSVQATVEGVMHKITHKIVCALLSLLLVMSAQTVVSAQDMPSGAHSPAAAAVSMSDCGHFSDDRSAGQTEAMSAVFGCGEADSVACMGSGGSGQCVMTMVLAYTPSFSFSVPLSHSVMPGPLFSYQNPFLDIITPPPDHLS